MSYFKAAEPYEPPPDARALIETGLYFVVHTPRETATLRELADDLTASGKYAAVLFSCATAQLAADDYGAASREVLSAIRGAAEEQLPVACWPPSPWPAAGPGSLLHAGLTKWARTCPRPLVLFADQVDALHQRSLGSVLMQLANGYQTRPESFPAAVVVCGEHDVRDYRTAAASTPVPQDFAIRLSTSSPFNVKITL